MSIPKRFPILHSRTLYIRIGTEGHVSSVYSERMSSRPMGWSETGTDRMCRLRCFIRNYGREKVIDLVKLPQGTGAGERGANRDRGHD
ncbi:MAG TPA: UPF0236 family protein [Candidatus Mediterraneibacter caccogallinarum]|nr:UPF0236 family protein [Candidatus Mediterraneibacter caccogallinarum]